MPDDNEPIGIVLAADKDEIMVEYATGSISNQLFVSRYQLAGCGTIEAGITTAFGDWG